jgi:transglutaminase-like putative cysteine protease
MALSQSRFEAQLEGALGRFFSAVRRVIGVGDVLTLLAATALLFMPAFAMVDAGWGLWLRIILPAAALSIVVGFGLARSRYDELSSLIISMIYGVCGVLIIAALGAPRGLTQGIADVVVRFATWMNDAVTGGINQDDLVFTLLVAVLFWSLGFNLAWHLFRIDRVWRAVLPPGFVILVNAVYYDGPNSLDRYLIVFTLITLLLLVRSNLEARAWDWYLKGTRVPRALQRQVFIIGAALALLVMGIGWAAPRTSVESQLARFQEAMQGEPLRDLAELWNRLFTSPDLQGPTTSDYYGSDTLQLGGAISLGDATVFRAQAPPDRRYYWRSRTFDNYDFGRWTSAADTRLTDPESPLDIPQDTVGSGARAPVEQIITIGAIAQRIVYTAPQPLRVDLPTRTDLRYAPDESMQISVIRPLRILEPGAQYRVASAMSVATAAQLRAAGTDYPGWVRTQYNNFIPSATGRTLELAARIVRDAGAVTPFDQARAIESWLRANITYNERIPAPPVGQDPVDWVLFDFREGYCNYYSSAMVVMLRSLGVPARMAAGFAQGTYDSVTGEFVVRERDAHTWVEVYFPGYGWVEFEPTSAQAPNPLPDEAQPTPMPTPVVSLTPLPTSTPLPSATPVPPTATPPPPDAAGLPPTATPDAGGALLLPTATPTFVPSPTPTPVRAAPPEPPEPPRPDSNPLVDFVLGVLRLVLIGLVVILLTLGLAALVYWYWEWRGFRGMNPIARVYARLQRFAALLGVQPPSTATPDERRDQIVRAVPAAERPVSVITQLYSEGRYHTPETGHTPGRAEAAEAAWGAARRGILGRWLRRLTGLNRP